MRLDLQEFTRRISNYDGLVHKPTQLVPFLVYFLEEHDAADAVSSQPIRDLFDELRVRPPTRISDVLGKSNLFVRNRVGGYRLSHQGRRHVLGLLVPSDDGRESAAAKSKAVLPKHDERNDGWDRAEGSRPHLSNRVLVIYGRDEALRKDFFALLRAVGLHPYEFEEMVQATGVAAPNTWDVIRATFHNVQACVALFSPDEIVRLRPELRRRHDREEESFQPRPNVLIEAGMAMAIHPERTVLVNVGDVRSFSDFDGKQYVRLTGSAESRNKLVGRLRVAGCDVRTNGDDWLSIGNFEI